jgi:signal transduction histidine kinase/DNA-binding NarL/FixJ family response regulator
MDMENKGNLRFSHSLLGRMLLLGVAPTVLILLVIILFSASQNYSSALIANENQLRSIAGTISREIERGNTRAVVAAKTMALAQENGLFGNRIASTDYARQMLIDFPEFTGADFCYEPNADQNDLAYLHSEKAKLIPANALDKNGRFLPYWYRGKTAADKDKVFLDNLLDMETSLYYQGNKEQFLSHQVSMPMITEPYIYEGKMIMEYTYPIVIDGKFMGVSGIDRSLTAILEFVQQIKDRERVDIFLISRMGKFISATSDGREKLVTNAIVATKYRDLFGRYYNEKSLDILELSKDPIDHQNYYFLTSTVKTGDWLVIVRKSEEAVLAPIRHDLYSQLIFAFIGLFIISFLSFIMARSISRRIGNAAKAANALASGGLSHNVDIRNELDDEIGLMNQSFNRVMARFRELTNVCVSISEGDFSKELDVKSERDILSEAINSMSHKRKQAEEDLKAAQNKAETANQAKSVFISSMSHEIRTPLNAIMGYSQILERADDLSDQQRDDIAAIHRAGKHLLSIINDILDFSKIEAGKMEVHQSNFDLESMTQDLFTIFSMRCKEKGLDLNVEGLIKNNKVCVRSDSVKLRQILVNLIGNAVKFTPSGSVTLLINPLENDNYYFEVRDTGQGIPLEKQTTIFNAFQQDIEGIKQGGTGLGLSISKTLLQLLGSDLAMESVPGESSRFFFTLHLPPAEKEEDTQTNAFANVSHLATGQTVKALLIDDMSVNLDVLTRVLNNIGIETRGATTGTEGLTLIDEFQPDIVFCDYHMQGLDGLGVTRHIINDHGDKEIKIVMISASVFEHHQEMYHQQGVDGFIGKPFVREEIFELLADLLGIEFENDVNNLERQSRLSALDFSNITLPDTLISSLTSAINAGQITKINSLFTQCASENLIATDLVQHLRYLTEDLNLEKVLSVVNSFKVSEATVTES